MQAFAVSRRYLDTRSAHDRPGDLAETALDPKTRPLSRGEIAQAKTAWSYFETFRHPVTGLAPSVASDQTISPWEIGATLIATTCAGRLGLISAETCQNHLSHCLQSIARLRTEPVGLPTLRYRVSDLRILSTGSRPIVTATGWSARGILRLVAGFIITAHHAPIFAPEISLILNKWSLHTLLHNGRFHSGRIVSPTRSRRLADLFLGHEQYAARTACLINLPAEAALNPASVLAWLQTGGTPLPRDKRCQAPLTTEAFALEALEYGWRRPVLDIALACFLAQKERFETTGHLTALTEDALDCAPGFASHAITAGTRPFPSLSRSGRDLSALRCLSTKAAFYWHSLLPFPYSQKLTDRVSELKTPSGWYAGLYQSSSRVNKALSLNTNAVILEALHYRKFGPLFPTNENARG